MYQKTKNKGKFTNWKRSKHGNFNNWNRRKDRYGAFIQKLAEEKEQEEKATTYWAEITPILQEFQKELIALGKPPGVNATKENILYCINIFDMISRCQDALDGGIRIAPKNLQKVVTEFNNDLFYAGRHTIFDRRKDSVYGNVLYWNTTDVGEPITLENIQFGQELGFSRQPASYWLSLSKKKKITVTAVQHFKKGHIQKPQNMWITEALVKTGINHFVKTAYQAFSDELSKILTESATV